MRTAKQAARGGRIWFIGGPLDNRLGDFSNWPPNIVATVDENGEPIEAAYRLEQLATPEPHAAVFFAYVFSAVTHAQLVERVNLPPEQPECEFLIAESEIDRRFGAPANPPRRQKIR